MHTQIMNSTDILLNHLRDLAERSYNNNMYTFSSFLSESEIAEFMSIERELSYAGITVSGGIETAERCVIRFGRESDLGYDQPFPISCLMVQPLMKKFGEDLGHRDYLGALMSLGIERELLGDIIIADKTAYIFCLDHIAEYIKEKLVQIRHTSVKVDIADSLPEAIAPRLDRRQLIVSSERLDAVVSKLYNLSRSQAQELFKSKKIFVNGLQCENTSYAPKPDSRISVRGFGKFIYAGIDGMTGKGRCKVSIDVYI